MNDIPFPEVIDNSLVSAFQECPTKCFNEYFQHWKPKTPNVHLHAGGAYARGLEVARLNFFGESRPERESVAAGAKALVEAYVPFECPPDSAKSLERMLGAFEFYFDQYPMGSDTATPYKFADGRLGVEFNFVEPLDVMHPDTGQPLLYTGRFDMLCDYQGGVYGEDDKTASQLGASWSRQWDLRAQFTGYCWGAKKHKLPIMGFLIRGVSILKTKYDTQQAITYRAPWQIEEWYENLCDSILPDMIHQWEKSRAAQRSQWKMALGEACNQFGGCPFKQVCLAEPTNRLSWLETKFERRRWDPVTRVETML